MTDYQPASAAPVVIALPHVIDASNARQIDTLLTRACQSGASAVIADMTRTAFCDSAGFTALAHARQHAAGRGMELSAAVCSAGVLRMLTRLGLDEVMPVYPSLSAALTAVQRTSAPAAFRLPTGPG